MSAFDIDEFDKHIRHLQSQLAFFAEALDATDESPEWLAADLIQLKGKTSMLCDDMRRVRKRAVKEGVVSEPSSSSNKRLSLENAAPSNTRRDTPEAADLTPPQAQTQPAHPEPPPEEEIQEAQDDTYQVQYIDITDEVQRRLAKSRLKQLMDSPSTSQKRKFGALETEEENEDEREDIFERSPTKKLKFLEPMARVLRGVSVGSPGRQGASPTPMPDSAGMGPATSPQKSNFTTQDSRAKSDQQQESYRPAADSPAAEGTGVKRGIGDAETQKDWGGYSEVSEDKDRQPKRMKYSGLS